MNAENKKKKKKKKNRLEEEDYRGDGKDVPVGDVIFVVLVILCRLEA